MEYFLLPCVTNTDFAAIAMAMVNGNGNDNVDVALFGLLCLQSFGKCYCESLCGCDFTNVFQRRNKHIGEIFNPNGLLINTFSNHG